MTTEIKNKDSNYKGSFWVSKRSFEVLFENNATAEQMLAYLVLARFNVEVSHIENKYSRVSSKNKYYPIFSSAGKTSLKTYLGISAKKAGEILKSLVKMTSNNGERILFDKEGWGRITRNFKSNLHLFGFPEEQEREYVDTPAMISKNEKHPILYALNTFGEKRGEAVWFPNELVAGVKENGRYSFKRPLKYILGLRSYKDYVARLIVKIYESYDYEYAGADPFKTFGYDLKWSNFDNIGNVSLLMATGFKNSSCEIKNFNDFLEVIGIDKPEFYELMVNPRASKLFYWKIFVTNESFYGLEKEMIFFDDNVFCNKVLYELYSIKNAVNFRPNDVFCLAGKIEEAIREHGYSVADSYGKTYRFNGKYPVLARPGEDIKVLGVVCPRIPLRHAGICDEEVLQALAVHRYEEGLSRIADLDAQPIQERNMENFEIPDV